MGQRELDEIKAEMLLTSLSYVAQSSYVFQNFSFGLKMDLLPAERNREIIFGKISAAFACGNINSGTDLRLYVSAFRWKKFHMRAGFSHDRYLYILS